MKATKITPRNRKKDNKAYWEVALEGSDKPLLMFSQPEFAEGTDIDDSMLQIAKAGTYYNLKTTKEPKPQARGYVKNDDDIMLQVALKAVVELECHHTVPEGKVNIKRTAQDTNELFASLLMMRPKKEKDA